MTPRTQTLESHNPKPDLKPMATDLKPRPPDLKPKASMCNHGYETLGHQSEITTTNLKPQPPDLKPRPHKANLKREKEVSPWKEERIKCETKRRKDCGGRNLKVRGREREREFERLKNHFFTNSWTVWLYIWNLTVARMENFLSLQPWMEHDNKGLVAKITTGGFLHPQC